METTFASATVLLFLITDPLGNIPVFASALRQVPASRRPRVILREHLAAFAVLLAAMGLGEAFLQLMGLRDASLQMAGGVVLLLMALRMVFPAAAEPATEPPVEPLIVPLAIPAIAGPSALATCILLVSRAPERRLEWVAALALSLALGALVLLLAERVQRRLGERFVLAMERLMGLILVALAVEMMLRAAERLF